MNCYIDQIDNKIAELVIDDQSIYIPLNQLPNGVKEGTHLKLMFQLDKDAEDDIKRDVANLIDVMTENDGGDFEL